MSNIDSSGSLFLLNNLENVVNLKSSLIELIWDKTKKILDYSQLLNNANLFFNVW